jgi:glutamate/aspartate transport system substrate-binding protein
MRIVSIARRSFLTLALLAALPAVAQTAPAAGTLAKLASTKTITLGVRRDAAPFSYLDAAGKPGGFSWALCQAIVQQLSSDLKTPLQVKFEPVTLVESFERLGDGRIDLHCGSTANTAERAERVAFSNTFFVSRVVAAHRAQDAKFASAREYGRTGVLQGSTAQKLMQTYASKKASTLALGALTPVPSYAEGVRLLKAGQIDTLVADELLIPKDAAIALRPEQLTVEPYALVMRKGDAAFVDAVDKALHKILGGAQGKQLAQDSGLKVEHLTRDAWQSPNKQPAPPVL